jgi:hypothetical protein
MRCEDAVALVAAEWEVFSLEADAQGNYAAALPDGGEIRLVPTGGGNLQLEGRLLEQVSSVTRSQEPLLQLLQQNFTHAIVHGSVLVHQRELDELALILSMPLAAMEEADFLSGLEAFHRNLAAMDRLVKSIFLPNPTGEVPTNPFAAVGRTQ